MSEVQVVDGNLVYPTDPHYLMIDGMDHDVPGRDVCFCHSGRYHGDCVHCGGFVHEQAVYGPSIVYVCEDCDKDHERRKTGGYMHE